MKTPRHCERKRSNPEASPGEELDCFACARNDGCTITTTAEIVEALKLPHQGH